MATEENSFPYFNLLLSFPQLTTSFFQLLPLQVSFSKHLIFAGLQLAP